MKILIVASLAASLRNFRGPLILAMQTAGHEVHAAAPGLLRDTETSSWLSSSGVICHDVTLARVGLNPIKDLGTLFQLYKLMRHVMPDVFLGYTAKPVIWGLLAGRLARVPQRVALITGLGYAFTDSPGGLRGLMRQLLMLLYRITMRYATVVFFQNSDDRADFQCMGLIPPQASVQQIAGSGIDLNHYSVKRPPSGPLRFLLIARLVADKGIREYVLAARFLRKRWPEVEFHLVGGIDPNPTGIAEAEVKSWHANGDVIWHGKISDVRPVLGQSHVYVLPSYREGTPRTVLEAMSMGRPIITTDAPGCRQTVVDGLTGFLVPVRNTEALIVAMTRFILDPKLIEQFGTAARARAEAVFDVNRVNAQMLKTMELTNCGGHGD